MTRCLLALAVVLTFLLAACGDDDDATPTPSASSVVTPAATLSPTDAPATPPTDAPTPTATYYLIGFPIDPATTLGVVSGEVGSRVLEFPSGGPTAYDYALNDQPSTDADAANRSGWNCRTHFEYEGIAAVDFYIPNGTTIYATHAGTATLYAVSVQNDFDRYGVPREPYIGNPDRENAPLSPFPGPSGGLGVYVEVVGDGFVTEYGHLDLGLSAAAFGNFFDGYSADSDWDSLFADVSSPRVVTPIAEKPVRRSDVIGYSGDAGYSEGPHLHYTLRRDGGPYLCPTTETGFGESGWLFR